MEEVESYQHILKLLENKATIKQQIFKKTSDVFNQFKQVLNEICLDMQADFAGKSQLVEVSYSDRGDFEVQLKFSGDVLILSMHSNVLVFLPNMR
jgi:hypothetical protein